MICYPYVHSFCPNFIIFRKHGNIPVGLHILALIECDFGYAGEYQGGTLSIGHFWVPKTPAFKMRPCAQPFLWKWVLFAWEWKIISISKADHLPSFWNRGPGELGKGLLAVDLISSFKPELCLSGYLFSSKAEQPAIMMIMMMMMMMMIIIIIAFLQHRKLLLTHYRTKKLQICTVT